MVPLVINHFRDSPFGHKTPLRAGAVGASNHIMLYSLCVHLICMLDLYAFQSFYSLYIHDYPGNLTHTGGEELGNSPYTPGKNQDAIPTSEKDT